MPDKPKTPKTCSICQRTFLEDSNNAWPVNDGRCCDQCDCLIVIPARIRKMGYPDAFAEFVGKADYNVRLASKSEFFATKIFRKKRRVLVKKGG